MRVPIFVTVAVVRLRIIAEGLAALYQIPMAVLSAPGSGLKEKDVYKRQMPRVLRASRMARHRANLPCSRTSTGAPLPRRSRTALIQPPTGWCAGG